MMQSLDESEAEVRRQLVRIPLQVRRPRPTPAQPQPHTIHMTLHTCIRRTIGYRSMRGLAEETRPRTSHLMSYDLCVVVPLTGPTTVPP
jgi:hypothetical protein